MILFFRTLNLYLLQELMTTLYLSYQGQYLLIPGHTGTLLFRRMK
uniref:Uncharacterized protein n=1 Tax=Arundo donax TaxID=35708 RepID=A0A0A9A463_ARUDO